MFIRDFVPVTVMEQFIDWLLGQIVGALGNLFTDGNTGVGLFGIIKAIPDIIFNATKAKRLPGILNITFPYASGESMMHLLDLKDICVSTGSACSSTKGYT